MRKSSLIKKNHGQKILECIGHFICLLGKKSKYKAVFFLLFFSPFFRTVHFILFTFLCLPQKRAENRVQATTAGKCEEPASPDCK